MAAQQTRYIPIHINLQAGANPGPHATMAERVNAVLLNARIPENQPINVTPIVHDEALLMAVIQRLVTNPAPCFEIL